jgi:hypothetical protein
MSWYLHWTARLNSSVLYKNITTYKHCKADALNCVSNKSSLAAYAARCGFVGGYQRFGGTNYLHLQGSTAAIVYSIGIQTTLSVVKEYRIRDRRSHNFVLEKSAYV